MKRILSLLAIVPLLLGCILIQTPSNGTPQMSSGTQVQSSGTLVVVRATDGSGAVARLESVLVDGCWNVRAAPSADAEILRVVCDEIVRIAPSSGRNGYVEVEPGGDICVQSFGLEDECLEEEQ